ncbi:UDP-glycosyltransferase UGT5-like [Melitaea cinxia]|uniref:UDP-glycosyltransferase UGT5-like n=1 Tax=Melitaea cinxia TaxID=113334 RepID=UPI001E27164B|nr:UDP-glycosyltransferase UGT5-like [Melitaea cinxia]
MFPPEKLKIFTDVISKLPYDVLWKWDDDDLPGRPQNVRLSKWFPQSDVLRHPKIKLFITQGGLQSTDEAITAAVPLVGVPMLGDQWFNVEQYIHHHIGIGLLLETLTEKKLTDAIRTVIDDER